MTFAEGAYPLPNRIAVGLYYSFVRLADNTAGRVCVAFSDLFQFVQPRELGLSPDLDRHVFRRECAFAAIGEYLDKSGQPPETADGAAPLEIPCFGPQFEEWAGRAPAGDDEILEHIKARVYWAWKAECDLASVDLADAMRLRSTLRTLKRVAEIESGHLWELAGAGSLGFNLRPTPSFLREMREEYRGRSAGGGVPLPQLLAAPRYAGPAGHWRKADAFARAVPPDLANAAKEAVCAVEGLARIITGDKAATLGELIKILKAKHSLNPAMAKTLEGIWGFTSNSPGVRHGGATPATIDDAEARYVAASCDAALRFLLGLDR